MAALCRVRVNWPACVLFRGMADNAVLCILWPYASVRRVFIRHQMSLPVNLLAYCLANRGHGYISNHASAKLAATFHGNKHGLLAGATSLFAGAFVTRSTRANVCFVAFNDACQFRGILIWCHCE